MHGVHIQPHGLLQLQPTHLAAIRTVRFILPTYMLQSHSDKSAFLPFLVGERHCIMMENECGRHLHKQRVIFPQLPGHLFLLTVRHHCRCHPSTISGLASKQTNLHLLIAVRGNSPAFGILNMPTTDLINVAQSLVLVRTQRICPSLAVRCSPEKPHLGGPNPVYSKGLH